MAERQTEWLGGQLQLGVVCVSMCECVCVCVCLAGGLLRPDYMFTVPQREWK